MNGKQQTADVTPDTPLLWVLRDALQLTGTKFGSGMAQCGACTVHLDGTPARACVSLDEGGRVRVHRVVCAVDCGQVVNPAIVEMQMESGIVYGLSAALHGRITLDGGRVTQGNFHDYRVVRMSDAPAIEVYIAPSTEAPGGVGEPGTPPIAPAVANALFALTGRRIRRLPIEVV